MAARKKKAGYHHGDLRQALIQATLVLARRHGARAVSLTDAAREAGVSVAAPYRHFADKESLLAAAAEDSFTLFSERLALARAAGTAMERLEQLALAYLRFFSESPERIELMFGIGLKIWQYPELLAASLVAFDHLRSAVGDVLAMEPAQGELLERRAHQVWYLLHGHAVLGVGNVGPQTPEPMRTVLESLRAMLHGFAEPTAPAPKEPSKPTKKAQMNRVL